tara:strand:+ start:3860 stop:4606 length:747 start_codon:yes stop_codon:yes gene_type:complete
MFRKPSGLRYRRYLRQLHASAVFDWYLEVGCRNGLSFAPVRSKTIAVDPYFRIESNVINEKPAMLAFQQTSDDFFASGVLQQLGIRLDFAFLDGMHLFEYLLRDIINTEARMAPGGVIALHDCCPFDSGMTTRDLDNLPKDAWTGDVWKVLPILAQYRSDLQVTVLDCRPTGLVLVTGLDPENRVLQSNYDAIVADWSGVHIDGYGPDRFYDGFEYTDAGQNMAADFPQFAAVRKSPETIRKPEYATP